MVNPGDHRGSVSPDKSAVENVSTDSVFHQGKDLSLSLRCLNLSTLLSTLLRLKLVL